MAELLKNIYSVKYINSLASQISLHHEEFDVKSFENFIFCDAWKSYELKQRMRHIALGLKEFLPDDYKTSIQILQKTAPNFSGMEAMYFQDFVELYGLNDWNISMEALACFTQYGSSEFAIRQFILQDQNRAIQQK